jgi:putative spermidine/putrescine transport system permease protein
MRRAVRPVTSRRGAALLVAPLLLGLLLGFVAPIGAFLWRAVADTEVASVLPRTIAALAGWDGAGVPGDAAFAALAQDLRAARARDQDTGAGSVARAAARLNEALPGMRSLLPATGRRVSGEGDDRARILAAGEAWATPAAWHAIRDAAGPVTARRLLATLDLRMDLSQPPPDQRLFRAVLWRTLSIAAATTLLCLALGYPLAWLIATAPARAQPWLLGAVLLPFWTSLIVRTAAWMVLLQKEGIVNAALLGAGVVEAPLPLLLNRFAVLVAMTHILLPFMVLPVLAVLREMDPRLPRAAASLGAGRLRVFLRVTLPLSLPGIGAGCLLVFIQALGFYVTPALLGGPEDQMLAWFIGFQAFRIGDWGMAAALSVMLLGAVALLVGLYGRLVGFDKVRTA